MLAVCLQGVETPPPHYEDIQDNVSQHFVEDFTSIVEKGEKEPEEKHSGGSPVRGMVD